MVILKPTSTCISCSFSGDRGILKLFKHFEQWQTDNIMIFPYLQHFFLLNVVLSSVQVMQLQKESGTAEEHSLDKEARKWASRVAREYKSIIHTQKVKTSDKDNVIISISLCGC